MQGMIRSVLAVARKARVRAPAMPLLGCGLAAWPTQLAARAHVKEVLEMGARGLTGDTVKVGAPGVTDLPC